jgi:hypothetical protein
VKNIFEIYRGKELLLSSSIDYGGYTKEMLMDIASSGEYKIYQNGKLLSKTVISQLKPTKTKKKSEK